MVSYLPESVLQPLRKLDTCTVANAIECFDLRLRNEGFTNNASLHCHFPKLPPMLGYVVTLRVRSANPPMKGGNYIDRTDWWHVLEKYPAPHVVVIEDADRRPGIGAFVGEVHAAILQALGCVGVVTNGAVRDLSAVEPQAFHLFSGTVSPSHAYVHVVDAGIPVEVAGLHIKPGDLLLGDQHGIVRIPPQIATELPATVEHIRAREREILEFCQSPEFSREGLRELVKKSRC